MLPRSCAPPLARLRTAITGLALVAAALLTIPAAAHAQAGALPIPSAGWKGRAIENPRPELAIVRTAWPVGWSAKGIRLGTGYDRPAGSERVRDLQRRLHRLGYRPGPVDGRFGPRTRAATRWFQYKHGLDPDGRVNRVTLAVLQARSDHVPLTGLVRTSERARARERSGTGPTTTSRAPAPVPVAAAADGGPDELWLFGLAVLAALAAGLAAGRFAPHAPWRTATGPDAAGGAPAVMPAATPGTPEVFGYVTLNSAREADAAIPALLTLCAERSWTLARILHDPEPPSGRMLDRPGLGYAVRAVAAGAAEGIVVAHLSDVSGRFTDLAALLDRLEDAGGFLAAADEPFDTTTPTGRATARAIVDLATWPTRSPGRFTRPSSHQIGPRLAALRERGLPPDAIADALNLARIPAPTGQPRWRPAGVDAAIDHEHET